MNKIDVISLAAILFIAMASIFALCRAYPEEAESRELLVTLEGVDFHKNMTKRQVAMAFQNLKQKCEYISPYTNPDGTKCFYYKTKSNPSMTPGYFSFSYKNHKLDYMLVMGTY